MVEVAVFNAAGHRGKATRTEALGRIPEARLKVLIPPQIGLEMLFPLEPTSTTGC